LSVIRKLLDLFPLYGSIYKNSAGARYVYTYTCKAPTDRVMTSDLVGGLLRSQIASFSRYTSYWKGLRHISYTRE